MKLAGISGNCLACLHNLCRSGMVKCAAADWFYVPTYLCKLNYHPPSSGKEGKKECGREGRKGRKGWVRERRKQREEGMGAGEKEGKGGRDECRREGRKGKKGGGGFVREGREGCRKEGRKGGRDNI